MTPSELWTSFQLNAGQTLQWRSANAELWLKRNAGDWLAAEKYSDTQNGEPHAEIGEESPEGLDWRRWAFNETTDTVTLQPVMPDRPLIVRPRTPLMLAPNMDIQFFINIPPWVSAKVAMGEKPFELLKTATLSLSNTWFGDQYAGELCYALKSRALREYAESDCNPGRILCPFLIKNRSETALPLEKICVRVSFLNIYRGDYKLWTNQVTVIFRGEKEPSDVEYAESPPEQARNPELITEAKEKAEYGFFHRTFGAHPLSIFQD